MNNKPTIKDLNDPEKFELLASVEHGRIKEFVLQQVMTDKVFIPAYMIYQTLLFFSGLFFLTRSIILSYRGDWRYLLISGEGILFSFTVLVVIHELLHGLALKLTGAPSVTFGGILRKFIFFAEADNYVLGRTSFLFVAFTPLVVVQIITIIGIVFWFYVPFVYFFLMVMTIHSFFSSGDVALVTIFYRFSDRETFTYDNSIEKKSYYFVKR
jgi:Putative zincin peptidase